MFVQLLSHTLVMFFCHDYYNVYSVGLSNPVFKRLFYLNGNMWGMANDKKVGESSIKLYLLLFALNIFYY